MCSYFYIRFCSASAKTGLKIQLQKVSYISLGWMFAELIIQLLFSLIFRHHCINIPDILPKILLAVKWNSRDEVAQVS